ncbi:ribonuclease H-like domain-containing protein [Tanacetum coccineum]
MVIRFRVGINRHTQRLTLHVSSISPLPKLYVDVFNDPNWQNAMNDEYNALIKNSTWTLVPRPAEANVVRCMWLFRHKHLADGTLSRYKACLVANGSTQLSGVNVDKTFSLVVKPGTIRTVLSLDVSRHWPIHQLDVKNSSKCQLTLSRSSIEVEYHGVANAVSETCWLRNLLYELHTPLSSATLVYCDNVSPVYLSSNPVQHQRTKHIEIDIHFVRDLVVAGHVRVLHIPSRYQYADIFTKGLS